MHLCMSSSQFSKRIVFINHKECDVLHSDNDDIINEVLFYGYFCLYFLYSSAYI